MKIFDYLFGKKEQPKNQTQNPQQGFNPQMQGYNQNQWQ